MSDRMLEISDDLRLPVDAVTETFLILGKRGAGKTNTAVVFAEEMISAGLRTCIVDPTGVWWGLRSSADGQSAGLPVIIFGGEHADLPLPPDSGRAMADLIVDEPDLVVILDLKLMSKTKQRQFMLAFLERLYHRNRDPLHLIIDEADLFCPQRATADIAPLLGAFEDIVRRGRANGIGSTSITQRPAGMNTDIRSQPEVLITLRLIGKHDIVAIDEWVRTHADEDAARELKRSLPSLPTGTAWVWSPGWLEILKKLQVRQRRTFDSSATPKVGQQRIVPRTLAQVDISTLRERMAAVVEKAANDDPAALRKRIADLERSLRARREALQTDDLARARQQVSDLAAALAEARSRPLERVEVPVVTPGDVAALEQSIAGLRDIADALELALGRAVRASSPSAAPAPRLAPAPRRDPPADGEVPALGKAQRAILTVLAQFPAGRTKVQLAFLSGYSPKSSGFDNALGALRSAGLVNRGTPIQATDSGIAALGGDLEPLPEGEALIEHWMGRLGKAERILLRIFIDAWPLALTREQAAERSGYSERSSGFDNALGRLRSLELIRGWQADETVASQAHRDREGTLHGH